MCCVMTTDRSSHRHSHDPGPPIQCGKTGHDLPVYTVSADCDRDIFAAFTGPDGGITSIANTAEQGRKPDSRISSHAHSRGGSATRRLFVVEHLFYVTRSENVVIMDYA